MKKLILTEIFTLIFLTSYSQTNNLNLWTFNNTAITFKSINFAQRLDLNTPLNERATLSNERVTLSLTKSDLINQSCNLFNYSMDLNPDYNPKRRTGGTNIVIGLASGIVLGYGLGALATQSYTDGTNAGPWVIGGGVVGLLVFGWAFPLYNPSN